MKFLGIIASKYPTVAIRSTPQAMRLAADLHEYLMKVPRPKAPPLVDDVLVKVVRHCPDK